MAVQGSIMIDMVDMAVFPLGCDPGSSAMTMPKYEAFAEMIRGRIRSGIYKPGDRLPSTATFVAEGWKQSTVVSGHRLLRSEGWTRGQPGEAVFVAESPPVG